MDKVADGSRTEHRDGMLVTWDVPITVDDGLVLRADVFRQPGDVKHGVILTYGPYAKGLAFQEGYKAAWHQMVTDYPEVERGSSCRYQVWELVDPEKWVPEGYACVRVDSRGTGRSPGVIDILSDREARDLYACIEWAGVQPWSNGKVGVNGISYYAQTGWLAAALNPPHLAALCAWEGECDYYRELARHGGILCDFIDTWSRKQIRSVQHGRGEHGYRSQVTGEPVSGPPTLSEDELARNRVDFAGEALRRETIDAWYRARLPDLEAMRVPLLSAANWGGHGLHPRGNVEGYLRAGSPEKWLEVHGDTHFSHFYSDYGLDLQKRFFGHFLLGRDTGWADQPRVLVNVRRPGEDFTPRAEAEWPLARTRWTRYFLQPDGCSLSTEEPASETTLPYDATGEGLTFLMPALDRELEITGPLAAKLWLSSRTADADVFLVVRLFDPEGREVSFIGANDPRTPIGLGWLRASHRKLDPERTRLYRPYHTHDEKRPLTPGEAVELDVEIWPTCIVVPPGYRFGLTVRGKDYTYDGKPIRMPHGDVDLYGVGPFTHTNPEDRPMSVFGGVNTLHLSPGRMPYLLVPVIP